MAIEQRFTLPNGLVMVPNGEYRQPKEGEYFISDKGRMMRCSEDGQIPGFRAILKLDNPFEADDSDEEENDAFILVCGNCLVEVGHIELRHVVQISQYRNADYFLDGDDLNDGDEDRDDVQRRIDKWVRQQFSESYEWRVSDNEEDSYSDGLMECECPHCGHESEGDDNYFWVTTEAARVRAEALMNIGADRSEVIAALCKTE